MKSVNRLSQKAAVPDVHPPKAKPERDIYQDLLKEMLPRTPQETEEFLKGHHSEQEGE